MFKYALVVWKVWLALFALAAFGQTGEIHLSVKDPSGAAMDASER